jgi:hypothetical protein
MHRSTSIGAFAAINYTVITQEICMTSCIIIMDCHWRCNRFDDHDFYLPLIPFYADRGVNFDRGATRVMSQLLLSPLS